MKNVLKTCVLALIGLFVLASCSNEDNPSTPDTPQGPSELEEYFFTIQNAVYKTGAIPTATIDEAIEGLQINTKAISGGQNIITITTTKEYKKFFVGAENVNGYLEISQFGTSDGTEQAVPKKTDYGYMIPVLYSTLFNTNITMIIAAQDKNDNVTKWYVVEIKFVETQSGDLEVNMVFDNAKDVDLHLYTPSGRHIYYGDRGGVVDMGNGETLTFGLDKDSNAGCNIDNLNNENIYIPGELVENGTYTVVVDMYSNCNTSIATNWSVVARYKNEILRNELSDRATNPVLGVYPVGAGNHDLTPVMKFTITDANDIASNQSLSLARNKAIKAIPLSDMDMMKKEEAEWYK